MKSWKESRVRPDMPLLEVLQVITDTGMMIAFVVDDRDHLLGIITDGDVRRAILRGVSMTEPASAIMNTAPITIPSGTGRRSAISRLQKSNIRYAPMVDADGVLTGFCQMQELLEKRVRSNPVVIMAGGLGTRLRPLTDNCPKPLLRVGGKPILETILEGFLENGFRNFYFSVNYRSEMIEDYFGDGSRYGAEICFLHENERLGTAGALSLLPEKLTEPAFVMNGDILTKLDFGEAIDFHEQQGASATMLVRKMSYRIPYGVVQCQEDSITKIMEKPSYAFYINAGMYVLSPEALSRIKKREFLDMPELFTELIKENLRVKRYPVSEYWMDIGQMDDFHQAQLDYAEVFAE